MMIKLTKYHVLYLLVLCFLLTGCKVRRPRDVIPEGQMEELLFDYHIAKAMSENLPYSDNYKRAMYLEFVFQKHNTTQAAFDSSMVWYTRNADVLSKIYERVSKRLREEQTHIDQLVAMRDNTPEMSAAGDSVDVWFQHRLMHLTGNPLNNRLTFVIPSDTNFKARDTIQWDMHYFIPGVRLDSANAALMSMAIKYANDSIITQTNRIIESGLQRIRLQADTLGDIKEIRGFVYYPGDRDSIRHLLANRISLIRFHSRDSLFEAKTDTVVTEVVAPEAASEVEVIKADTTAVQQHERIHPDSMRRRQERPRPLQRTVPAQEVLR